jgi:hypothetical protein
MNDAGWDAGVREHLAEQSLRAETDFGRFQDDGVAEGERSGNRPYRQYKRRIPWRDAETGRRPVGEPKMRDSR